MDDQPNHIEEVGPQARIRDEILKLSSRQREGWLLVAFAAAVLLLGVLSLLFPNSFWHQNELGVRFSPQILFVVMMGMVVAMLQMVRRETEMRKLRLTNLQQALTARLDQAASMVDALTHVFTRAFLRDVLQGEIKSAERNNRPLSLLMCDLDDFKRVNDRYGHLMGDYVLAQVAAILKSCVRGSDYIIRYGGDEFLILLPETDEKGAEVVRNRIRRKVAEWDRTTRVGDLPVSVSMGVFLHTTGHTAEQDVAEADVRMYAEKQTDRGAPTVSRPAKP